MATQWYYKKDDAEFGPVSFRKLSALVRNEEVVNEDLVREDWQEEWRHPSEVIGLMRMVKMMDGDDAPETALAPTVADDPTDELEEFTGGELDALLNDESTAAPTGWMRRMVDVVAFRRPKEKSAAEPAGQPAASAPADPSLTDDDFGDGDFGDNLLDGGDQAESGWRQRLADVEARQQAAAAGGTGGEVDFVSMPSGIGDLASEAMAQYEPQKPARISRWQRLKDGIGGFRSAVGLGDAYTIGVAFVVATAVGLLILNWSEVELIRFPDNDSMAGQKHAFPFWGECGEFEYMFLLFDVMLFSGIAAYFGARRLESMADD